jgi:hypothetical protein
MRFLLCLLFLFSTVQANQIDSLNTKLLKYELREQLRRDLKISVDSIKSDWEKEMELAKSELRLKSKEFSIYITIANLLIFVVGISIILAVRRSTINKMTKMMYEKLYSVDPLYMPIKIPESVMDLEYKRLKDLRFRNIKKYNYLDNSCVKDVVIFYCENDENARIAQQFMMDKNLKNKLDVIFIIYKKGKRVEPSIFEEFSNVTYANTPLTLVQALIVARIGMIK